MKIVLAIVGVVAIAAVIVFVVLGLGNTETQTSNSSGTVPSGTTSSPDVFTVDITPQSPSIAIGSTLQLITSLKDEGGKAVNSGIGDVDWESSNTSVATISSSGLVTGISIGSVTITVRFTDNIGWKDALGTVMLRVSDQKVASVAINPQTINLGIGESSQVLAVSKDENGDTITGLSISWTSSNTAVATVSSTGLITGVSKGESIVIASVGGVSASASVSVTDVSATSIEITPSKGTLSIGQSSQLSARLKDARGNIIGQRNVSWSSSDTTIVTVSNAGMLTAISDGESTITASFEGVSGFATVTVSGAPVASISVSSQSASISVGQTQQLTASVSDAGGNILNDRIISWTTSNEASATVSSAGLVTGIALGSSTITVNSEGKSATVVVEVSASPVSSVSVTPQSVKLSAGQTQQLSETVTDKDGKVLSGFVIIWSSTNSASVTVSNTGLITGIAPGSSSITATIEGKIATASVNVTKSAVSSIGLKPDVSVIRIDENQQMVATVKSTSGGELGGIRLNWSSSDSTVATVSTTGVVTGKSVGTASIIVSFGGVTAQAKIEVIDPD
tara:strand:+ start:3715 stop:5412 length:1698 start_codon:yes stop_codon:yes gene_type:complete